MDKLVGALWGVAIAVLDRYLDSQIGKVGDPAVRDKLRMLEDMIVGLLASALGLALAKAIARPLATVTMDRWLQNRPDTRHWG